MLRTHLYLQDYLVSGEIHGDGVLAEAAGSLALLYVAVAYVRHGANEPTNYDTTRYPDLVAELESQNMINRRGNQTRSVRISFTRRSAGKLVAMLIPVRPSY